MRQKPARRIKSKTANVFGAFGYLFCLLQWLWITMLYFSVLQAAIVLLSPPAGEQAQQLPRFTFAFPSPLELIIVAIVITVMAVLTVYILVKLPFAIAQTSRKAVHKTSEKVVPIAIKVQHKKDSKKLRAQLTFKIIFVIKILLVIVPVILTAGSGLLDEAPIRYFIAILIGGGLAGLSLLFFAVQYLLASLLRVKMSELW